MTHDDFKLIAKTATRFLQPWSYETEFHTKEKTWGIWSEDDSQSVICQHVQTIDDARLIAAAPDLLAALVHLLRGQLSPSGSVAAWAQAREAVAKAEGGAA
jgi:hypothetical protein